MISTEVEINYDTVSRPVTSVAAFYVFIGVAHGLDIMSSVCIADDDRESALQVYVESGVCRATDDCVRMTPFFSLFFLGRR